MGKISCFGIVFIFLFGWSVQAQTKNWTIEECVNYALEHNISIKQSNLDNELAAIDKNSAFGGFLPSISADASHSWNIGLNQNITTGLLQNQTTQFSSLGLNAGVDIYKGMQNQNRLRRANLSILAAQYNLKKMKDDISLYVANAFLQILFDKENIKVQNLQLSNNEKQLQKTEELVKAGSIPRGDLLDIKATVASNKQKVINAENAFLISKLSLAQLLQLDDFKNFDIADSDYITKESATMLLAPETIYQKAKEERVELKIARTNLAIAEKEVKIAKGAYQPTLQGYYRFNTRAGYANRVVGFEQNGANPTSVIGFVEGTNQQVLQPNFSPILGKALPILDQFNDNKGHNFGFQLNVPILNGFSIKNNVERYKVNLEKSKIALNQSELDLQRNVYTAFTDANGALKAYESAVVALDARQEAFNYAAEKYSVGIMNAFDFNQSQTLFSNAQSEVLRTKYDYIFRVKVLEFYFGIPIIQKK
ncbi:TolC family protein [Flavobacterium psychrotolerans]|uniref:Transporter n=1 Tax=Flavobacterium psychrotolerans TaxID=2169410 RepID=A0A2U1JNP2_9FLAO|nr:TolC family protein [Flavobacterium psychrotolerans]PWA06797.1 transporter [Flavobacterium psychrotolerans]